MRDFLHEQERNTFFRIPLCPNMTILTLILWLLLTLNTGVQHMYLALYLDGTGPASDTWATQTKPCLQPWIRAELKRTCPLLIQS